MASKRPAAGQGALDLGAPPRHKAGAVERQANADLRTLREREELLDGGKALEQAYKLLAATIDDAHRDGDRYAVINAVRELLRVREALVPVARESGAQSVEDYLASLNVA